MTFSKFYILLSLIVLINGCGLFIKIDQPGDDIVYSNINNQKLCKIESNFTLASQTNTDLQVLKENIQSFAIQNKLRPIETFAMWSLIQMYIRPDKVSPSSSLQFIDSKRKKKDYYSFNSKEIRPYLFFDSLNYLLKDYNSRKSLKQIARYVDQVIGNYQLVDSDTAKNLLSNRQIILTSKKATKLYFKGQQVLREGEALRTYKMSSAVRLTRGSPLKPNNYLFKKQQSQNKEISCNFDTEIYKNGVYLIEPNLGDISHPYSLKINSQSFMAITSQQSDYSKIFKNTYSFQASSTMTQKAMCKVRNKDNQVVIISSSGRDSGQHIYNLLEYDISSSTNKKELQEVLEFPRFLFLLNPKRMIYESDRSSDEQIQNFLNTGFPIYHRQNLGNIWLHYTHDKTSAFILDSRKKNSLSCLPSK